MLRQYDRFEATFTPRRTDDLKEGAEAWVGQRVLWEAVWLIGEEDGGPYVGEFACMVAHDADDPPAPFVWAPSGDLADVVMIDRLLV